MYDAVNLKDMHDECLKDEHNFGILHQYKINKYLFPVEQKTFDDLLKHAAKLK